MLFTVEVTDPTTGAYHVTLKDNVLHSSGPNDENADPTASLTYTITDSDGSHTTGTLNVTFDDDAPTAVAGAALNVGEKDGVTIGENLLANDAQGADGATLTHVNFGSGFVAITTGTNLGGGTYQFTNANGVYTFKATGDWTFDPSENPVNTNTHGDFQYQITDGDGDTSTASQAVNIANANSQPTAGDNNRERR